MIALYARVSRDDGESCDSGSLVGQQLLMEAHLQHMESCGLIDGLADEEVAFFSDDGYSGMSLERPALRRLLAQCGAGNVTCVVVRDLSRLSRNYIDLGDLIEGVFPMCGVRFLWVAEGIDLAPTGVWRDRADADLHRNLVSIVNNAYSTMLSRSVRTSMQVSWLSGNHVQALVPFGYVYDRDARGHLGVDPLASQWVRMMFGMAARGEAPSGIAFALQEQGVPTPAKYAQVCGGPKAACFRGETTPWNARKVRYIVEREVYAGVLVGGATRSLRVGRGGPRCRTRPCEQIRVEGAHEPIVSLELFEAAQEALRRVGRGRPRKQALS